ncbi:MAG: hypothetical protein ACRDRX_03835 [Pseudonocardiaceae bacterium]
MKLIVDVLVVLIAAGLAAGAIRGNRHADAPARIAEVAARRAPARLGEWAQAMLAELATVQGRARRWRFAAGVVRVVMVPPLQHRGRVLVVACLAALGAAGSTLIAVRAVPSLSVFLAVLGGLLALLAILLAWRTPRLPRHPAQLGVGVLALVGLASAVGVVVRIAVVHPAATEDPAHLFSVLLALMLTGFVAFAAASASIMHHRRAVLWSSLGGAVLSATVWIITALSAPFPTESAIGMVSFFGPLSPAALVATLGIATTLSAATGSARAGARAGMLTAVLGAPLHFAINMTASTQRNQHRYTLTHPYDIAAYPHSGFPDVASYLISDDLGGSIIAGLVIATPILAGLAMLAAALGKSLHLAFPPGRAPW